MPSPDSVPFSESRKDYEHLKRAWMRKHGLVDEVENEDVDEAGDEDVDDSEEDGWKDAKLWNEQREMALERAGYQCSECGMTNTEHKERDDVFPPNAGLHVHHVVSKGEFDTPEKAHSLSNLKVLCYFCHDNRHRHRLGPKDSY